MNLDCLTCDETLKRERGCNAKGIIPYYIDEEPTYRCPLKMVTEESWEYLKAFLLYRKNMMPHGIGWLNESDKFLNAMFVLDNELIVIDKEESDKKQKGKHGRLK